MLANEARDIDLGESWVLGISVTPRSLSIDFDFVLLPGHPMYAPARSGELYCYRRGTITFHDLRRLHWSNSGQTAARDATGEEDWDHPVVHEISQTQAHVVSELGDIEVDFFGGITIDFRSP